MFLAWNYTLEAFFWIIVGGIALVSLTIFMARPKASTPPLLEFDLYEGYVAESDSYSDVENLLQHEDENLEPEEIAEAEFEAFVETLPEAIQSIISIRAAIAVLYGLLIICFGFIDLEINGSACNYTPDSDLWLILNLFYPIISSTFCGLFETSVFVTSIGGGVALIYGVNQKSPFMSKWGGRLVATYCFFLLWDTGVYWFLPWKAFLTILALVFSSDLFYFWKWTEEWEVRAEKSFIQSFSSGVWRFILFLIVVLLFVTLINVLQVLND
jgi:hypothetical protein